MLLGVGTAWAEDFLLEGSLVAGWGQSSKLAGDETLGAHVLELLGNCGNLLHAVLVRGQVTLKGLMLADQSFDV